MDGGPILAHTLCTRGPRGRCANNRLMESATERTPVLRQATPGKLYPWVKRASYVELALFMGLLVAWIAPGMERATFYFGLAHGIGFIALAIGVWIAVLRHEAPWTLLAATLTPVGPVGSVIAIHFIERRWARESLRT